MAERDGDLLDGCALGKGALGASATQIVGIQVHADGCAMLADDIGDGLVTDGGRVNPPALADRAKQWAGADTGADGPAVHIGFRPGWHRDATYFVAFPH